MLRGGNMLRGGTVLSVRVEGFDGWRSWNKKQVLFAHIDPFSLRNFENCSAVLVKRGSECSAQPAKFLLVRR